MSKRLEKDAFERGQAARREGRPREACPFGDYPSKAVRNAWLAGWDAAAPPVVAPEPLLVTPSVQVVTPGSFWPKGTPLPQAYRKPRPHPCPQCLAVTIDGFRKAVLLLQICGAVAYLRCRACEHRFRLPVAVG